MAHVDKIGDGGISLMNNAARRKKKQTLSAWNAYSTVNWFKDAQKDFEEHSSLLIRDESKWAQFRAEIMTWLIPALVGFVTATSGCLIEKLVEFFGDMRFGYCSGYMLSSKKENCATDGGTWYDWPNGFAFYIIVSTLLATTSAWMTWRFAPMARGSGIPEIKTILGGFSMPEVLELNTLIVKIIGLSLSVAAGLSCGKEGPLVHIACCWSNIIAKYVPRLRNNEAKQRELLSCACAAGVAVAFGAPMGGVLFSYEEASSVFPNRTMLRAFFGASVAALSLAWWDPTGTGKLTMFEAQYTVPPVFTEYGFFLLLGCMGGVIGATFVHLNIMVAKARAPNSRFREKCPIIVEVLVIALITAITSYPFLMTKVLSNVTIRALFHQCDDPSIRHLPEAAQAQWRHEFMLDLCDNDGPSMTWNVVGSILLAGLLRYLQMIITFGTGAPSGLFIPSLLTGAALGRAMGTFSALLNESMHFTDKVYPGVYAMVGAASVLGGVCRVTISLVVIMFELTSGLQLIVPFMIACLSAKWVGDAFNLGIYDYMIVIRGYPFLHEPDGITFQTTAEDIMDERLEILHPEPGNVGELVNFLSNAKYGGFPLTKAKHDRSLLGYVYTADLHSYLEMQLNENPLVDHTTPCVFENFMDDPPVNALDISKFVNMAVVRAVPEMPCTQIHSMFRLLGINLILVQKGALLVGMITKKSFIKHMDTLHHGHHEPPGRVSVCNFRNSRVSMYPNSMPLLAAGGAGAQQQPQQLQQQLLLPQ